MYPKTRNKKYVLGKNALKNMSQMSEGSRHVLKGGSVPIFLTTGQIFLVNGQMFWTQILDTLCPEFRKNAQVFCPGGRATLCMCMYMGCETCCSTLGKPSLLATSDLPCLQRAIQSSRLVPEKCSQDVHVVRVTVTHPNHF